jgi:2-dehydro-3-deoxyphosphogluconate aldolase / (4S)-4-hydroxy-2-oxoglutarate aldolase
MGAQTVIDSLLGRRVIPVVVVRDVAVAHPLGEALAAGGLPVAEVTFRTAAAEAALRVLAETDLLVGAGTVLHPELVDRAVEAGARFVVTPGFSDAVVSRCAELGVPVIPGVATASEVMAALAHGLDVLKLFPAGVAGGPALLRALAGPFPDVRFVPTGGVSAASMADYLRLSCVAAVGGSWMVAPSLLEAGDFAEVTRLTTEAVALARGAT